MLEMTVPLNPVNNGKNRQTVAEYINDKLNCWRQKKCDEYDTARQKEQRYEMSHVLFPGLVTYHVILLGIVCYIS
jgi:hypothetical protein